MLTVCIKTITGVLIIIGSLVCGSQVSKRKYEHLMKPYPACNIHVEFYFSRAIVNGGCVGDCNEQKPRSLDTATACPKCPDHYCFTEDRFHVCCTKIPIESVMSKSPCSTPGYIRDSLLGCYKIIPYPTAVTYDVGRHTCVNDGGQLFLVNSAKKGAHLLKAIRSEMITSAVIQGSRGPGMSWFDEHGDPLLYLPSFIENKDDEDATKLMLKFAPDSINVMFSAISERGKYRYFVCEL